MQANNNIYFEHGDWGRQLGWSAILHLAAFAVIAAYVFLAGSSRGDTWGEGDMGSAMGATLVSKTAVPLPPNPVQTQNIVANQSLGISHSEPKAVEETPEALAIPEREKKIRVHPSNSRAKRPPPPPENVIPYGEGGPVSGPYTTFSAQNIEGGLNFGGSADFGHHYGWYVDVVRRKVAENWLKYEVDPSITAARRVYLTFDILRDGSPTNVQVEETSGVPSLDQSAVRALQRIDSFGPLPQGYSSDKVSVEFWFDYKR